MSDKIETWKAPSFDSERYVPVSSIREVLNSSPFFTIEEQAGRLVITGIALAQGIWKNVLYPAEEIAKASKNLAGKPLKVEHGMDEEFKDKTVGKVLEARYDPDLKALVFKAEVDDPKAIEKVKDGTFPAVSCSTWLDKFPVNQEQSIGFNFNFNELSLVRSPACDKCFIFSVEKLSQRIKSNKDLNINEKERKIGEEKMSEETKEETVEELETEEAEEEEEELDISELEAPKLYAVLEFENLSDLLEEMGTKKVISYYYGYPYPYYGYPAKKYPYPHYPYYPYYGYPYYGYSKKKPKKVKREKTKKSLWAVLELESPEEVEDLKRKAKKVVSVYYGYYGYPYPGRYGYPYYGYPYYPYYGKYPMPKSEEIPQSEEMKEEEKKCPEGQVWDPEQKKCVPEEKASLEEELFDILDLAEDYKTFMKKCLKDKAKEIPDVVKRMKACAEEWKKKEKAKEEKTDEEHKCPEGQVWDEKQGKCVPANQYPAPAKEEKASEETIEKQAEEIAENLSEKEEKKEEAPAETKEETKEVKEEEVKEEAKEVKAEEQTEPPKAEPQEVKEETAEVKETEVKEEEKPKEEPKVEAKEEEKPKEEEKSLTPEEIEKYVKEHYPEIILELIKDKKF